MINKLESVCDKCNLLPFYEELAKEIKELKKINKKLNQKIESLQKDFLTGVYTRRYFDKLLNTEYKKKFKKSWFYNMILIDLNNLHEINRLKGYEEGDKYIINVINYIRQKMEENNVSGKIFRIGGDEFLIIYQPYDELNFDKTDSFTFAKGAFNSIKDFREEFKRLDKEISEKKLKRKKERI